MNWLIDLTCEGTHSQGIKFIAFFLPWELFNENILVIKIFKVCLTILEHYALKG